jgi:hypothetical protein
MPIRPKRRPIPPRTNAMGYPVNRNNARTGNINNGRKSII